jgi:hypothetical protein
MKNVFPFFPALAAGVFLLLAFTVPLGAGPVQTEDLTRSSRAAGIEVRITLLPSLEGGSAGEPERLRFQVSIDTHAGSLMQYDLSRIAVLRTSRGTSVESGFVWEPESESSHHRSGILWLPGRVNGQPLLDESVESIELELKGLAATSRTFRWTRQELAASAARKMM